MNQILINMKHRNKRDKDIGCENNRYKHKNISDDNKTDKKAKIIGRSNMRQTLVERRELAEVAFLKKKWLRLTSRNDNIEIKIKTLLLYGWKTWTIDKKMQKQLDAFEC